MSFAAEELEDQEKFRRILSISYNDLVQFIFDYLKKRSPLMIFYWSAVIAFLLIAIYVRIIIAGHYPIIHILFQTFLGVLVYPVVCIPIHELLHVIPYFISGARNIRVGMDLKQFLFYVTAHRYVATPLQFRIVAIIPFFVISITLFILIICLPGLWKWSFSLFLFAHSTMCAGDFALLNFYSLNSDKKIYTWDDADKKEAYFYEKL
jgi:Putative zincin peptidase